MSAQPSALGSWRLDDLLALPEDGNRYEIIEGQIVVSPPPAPGHQRLLGDLEPLLRARLDAGRTTIAGAGLRVPSHLEAQETFVVPDLMVVRDITPEMYYEPADVDLVVEVVSPGSVRRDRWYKRGLYAEMGIGAYLIVEPAERRLTLVRRPGSEAGGYAEVATSTGEQAVTDDGLLAGLSFASLRRGGVAGR